MNRIDETRWNSSLMREMRAIELAAGRIDPRARPADAARRMHIQAIAAAGATARP